MNFKIVGTSSIIYETEEEEVNSRRLGILENAKVVREFQDSNIPVLIEALVNDMDDQLRTIRTLENRITL